MGDSGISVKRGSVSELTPSRETQFRNELKYHCSDGQLKLMEMRIRHLLKPDPHAGEDGKYTVRSVYFDDLRDSCYYDNEDGVNNRQKFRIRLYNGDADMILLECKQKVNGRNHKDACPISAGQCEEILAGRPIDFREGEPVWNRFYTCYSAGMYRAKVIVEYERTPFIYKTGNVRVTFDRNIRATSKTENFLEKNLCARPVMQKGMQLLEVKYDELLPDYIYSQLQLDNLQLTANSKYYAARRMTKNFCI